MTDNERYVILYKGLKAYQKQNKLLRKACEKALDLKSRVSGCRNPECIVCKEQNKIFDFIHKAVETKEIKVRFKG